MLLSIQIDKVLLKKLISDMTFSFNGISLRLQIRKIFVAGCSVEDFYFHNKKRNAVIY